ncbi:MAG: PilT/PilU family type 4a pilus ATPase [Planctomycetes bacterium]|nr:PilT/PilU family type 4a pilus ATPase [Planctomycetota bacterium]
MTLDDLLTLCRNRDASDIHLSAGLPPCLRVRGVLEPQTELGVTSNEWLAKVVESLPLGASRESLDRIGSADGALSAQDGTRFRVNVFKRREGLSIALRRLEDQFRSLRELGLPDSLYELCDLAHGLVVVGGPTGSGKSTTLATLIDRINQTRRGHIITIEDPIEYLHESRLSLVNQRQVGTDAATFDDALVASLRQDPDVILVGEIREIKTIRTAITAAETGHLVFTTVHAGDCVGVIERMVSVFPAEEQSGVRRQLSLVLQAIVVQHLLVADGTKVSAGPQPSEKNREETRGSHPPRSSKRSRVVASEILRMTPAVANLIGSAKGNQLYSSMESSSAAGMQTFEQDLARLWVGGWISEQTATAYARNVSVLQDRAARLRLRK